MTQPEQTGDPRSELPADSDVSAPGTNESGLPKKLTAEEQMALYEKELKEGDWGHQPC